MNILLFEIDNLFHLVYTVAMEAFDKTKNPPPPRATGSL